MKYQCDELLYPVSPTEPRGQIWSPVPHFARPDLPPALRLSFPETPSKLDACFILNRLFVVLCVV